MTSKAMATRPGPAIPAIPAIAAGATGSAGTTWSAGPAGSAGATGSTASSRAAATTTYAAEIARCGRELPADAGARHLATTGPIVILGLVLLVAEHEATQAARLVAAITAGASAATAVAAPASIAASASIAAPPVIAAAAPGRCDAVDRVVVLATGDRAMWPLLALEHAHEANLVDAIANNIESFDHPRGAIRLHA